MTRRKELGMEFVGIVQRNFREKERQRQIAAENFRCGILMGVVCVLLIVTITLSNHIEMESHADVDSEVFTEIMWAKGVD